MLNIAVIGLGRLGRWHVANLMKIRDAHVSIVCDYSLEVAESVAKEHGVKSFTNNVDEVLNNEEVQAVVIVTPTNTHYEVIMKAIAANKAIFVEKPLTINMEESLKIQAEVEKTNAFVQVGFMRRFDRDYMEAKRIIDSGAIGKPIYFKAISRDPDAPELQFISQSGGMFIDMSIHDYDLARFLMGSEVKTLTAVGATVKYPEFAEHGDVDQATTHLVFENGAAGDVEGSRCAYYGYDIRTEVIGTEGTLFIGGLRETNVNILTKQGNSHTIVPAFPQRFEEAYVSELGVFVDAVLNNKPSPVTVEDSIKALEIAYAATESFKKETKITLTNN